MKKQLFTALALITLSAGAFAQPEQPTTSASNAIINSTVIAEDGSDRTPGLRIAEDGSDRTPGLRIAEDGSDRTLGLRIAEDGSDRTPGLRIAEDGSDRTKAHRHA